MGIEVQMPFIMKFLLTSLFVLLAFGQLQSVSAKPVSQSGKVQIYREANVSGVRIKFIDLVEDSRCPTDTQCIWAGNAKIRVQLSRNGRTKLVEMNTATEPRAVLFEGYEIKITRLTPAPASNVRIRKDGYIAIFSVVRKR